MAFRNDVSIDWWSSPRIITVASPSTTILIQDLYDTLRTLEAEINAADDNHLVNAGGKEDLGAGNFVGITMTLQNALLAFEARAGPSFEQCNVLGGNIVAIDDVGATQTTPIQVTAFTHVIVQQSTSPSIVTSTIVGAAAASVVAEKVWAVNVSVAASATGGMGDYIRNKVLNVSKFIGLK